MSEKPAQGSAGSPVPIVALSPNRASLRKMRLFQHVQPLFFAPGDVSSPEIQRLALESVRTAGLVQTGDRVLLTISDEMGVLGGTNTMKILTV